MLTFELQPYLMLLLGTPVDSREKSPVSSYSTYHSSFDGKDYFGS